MRNPCIAAITALAASLTCTAALAQPAAPQGEIKGDALVHTADSLAASVAQAQVCLPAAATGSTVFCGKFQDLPAYSTPSRTPFRFDGGQHSTVMADTVPD